MKLRQLLNKAVKSCIVALGSVFVVVLAFSFDSNTRVIADENFDPYTGLRQEDVDLMQTLDRYLTISNDVITFDWARAEADKQSENVLYTGAAINDLSTNIQIAGYENTVKSLFKATFPVGRYGNYCGAGNNGWNKSPIDDLDAACRDHDKCFKGFNNKSKACNRAFIRRLIPMTQFNNPASYKGFYIRAAIKLFSYWS